MPDITVPMLSGSVNRQTFAHYMALDKNMSAWIRISNENEKKLLGAEIGRTIDFCAHQTYQST